tara:strand:+ start:2862 stop:3152 length:291 start_codon:yes stop_codon:yes gene_type:complete
MNAPNLMHPEFLYRSCGDGKSPMIARQSGDAPGDPETGQHPYSVRPVDQTMMLKAQQGTPLMPPGAGAFKPGQPPDTSSTDLIISLPNDFVKTARV